MKQKSEILGVLPLFILIFGCVTGFMLSKFFVAGYEPSWKQQEILFPPKPAIKIVTVDFGFFSSPNDPPADVLYIASHEEELFSYSFSKSEWEATTEVLKSELAPALDKCGTVWSDADRPPIEEVIVDSVGFLFERTIYITKKCYVLYHDGSLELWQYETSSLGYMGVAMTRALYIIPGGIVGIIIGLLILTSLTEKQEDNKSAS